MHNGFMSGQKTAESTRNSLATANLQMRFLQEIRMKKFLTILTILGFASLSLFAKPKVSESTKATLQQCAKATQTMLPLTVDEATIFWGITSEDDTLIYYYAVKYTADNFEDGVFESLLKQTLINNIKNVNDATIIALKQLNTTFEHRYYGIDGQLISAIRITPKDYN